MFGYGSSIEMFTFALEIAFLNHFQWGTERTHAAKQWRIVENLNGQTRHLVPIAPPHATGQSVCKVHPN